MVTAFLFLAASTFQVPGLGITMDRDAIRFGMGFAALASEQCIDIKPGPVFENMMHFLGSGAKAGDKPFDKARFLAEVKAEALQKLGGKDICAEARKVARPDGVVSLK